MTWHETIEYIRERSEYKELVEKAYFEAELPLNVERFKNSEEFLETLKYLKQYAPNATSILDIGSGNGISVIAFALNGYKVTSIEPDPSNTIGAGAIRKLAKHYNLDNVDVLEAFAEDLQFDPNQFDIVYARQSMHHANNLQQFIKESVKGLKQDGLFISVRDHVIYDEDDKKVFLEAHPLHKFYGGENAFTKEEYIAAIRNAGLSIQKMLKHFDSVINYFPMTTEEFNSLDKVAKERLTKKLSFLGRCCILKNIYRKQRLSNEKRIPGRLYTFMALKK